MTQQSVQSYERKLQEAKDKINSINNVLANNQMLMLSEQTKLRRNKSIMN